MCALLQASYISGIAQGANVDQSQVTIVGVTSASTVTVNTQVCLYTGTVVFYSAGVPGPPESVSDALWNQAPLFSIGSIPPKPNGQAGWYGLW